MKKLGSILFLATLAFTVSIASAQTIDSLYEVGTWQDFRLSAINYSFDDNLAYHYSRAVPALDEVGFDATFNIVTGWSPQWSILTTMAGNGHEIASHMKDHTYLDKLSDSAQTVQLKGSQEIINANVKNQKCVTIVYPYCVAGNNAITSQYYISARTCQGSIEGKTPANFMQVSSVICGSTGVKSIGDFKTKINETVNKGGWCTFLIHEFDNGSGYSPLSSSVFKSSLYYCKVRNYKVWVSTFANITKYIKERNAASVKEISATDSVITVQVTDTLDNTLYDYPISIRRPLPANWKAATVTQGDRSINTMYVKKDTVTYVMFNVIPDSGEVKLKPADYEIDIIDQTIESADTVGMVHVSLPTLKNGDSNNSIKFYYASGNLHFELPADLGNDVNLSIYNTLGVMLASYRINTSEGVGNVQLSDNVIKSGLCIVNVSDGQISWTKKVAFM